jgi:hypothetical protein
MADEAKTDRVTLEELMLSSLAMTDALPKLMTVKGLITDEEFIVQFDTERADYLAVVKRLNRTKAGRGQLSPGRDLQ